MAAAVLMAGCAAPAALNSGQAAQERADSTGSPARLLTIATRYQVTRMLPQVPTAPDPLPTLRVFNAALTLIDEKGSVRPYLAEALPRLNTDTWRVFPDGRMETTYTLRPGLTWHDGQPLSAEDFVFAWRVYTDPALAIFPSGPPRLMEAVVAGDPRTLLIRWRSPYPDAGNLQMGDFDPLARHMLDQPFTSLQQDPAAADAFLGLPYWMAEYIGAGPYRLVGWEPGSYFEGIAFDGHALGRAKIDHVIVRIVGDDNVMLTNILAGALDWGELRFEGGRLLQRDWVPTGQGIVIPVRANSGAINMAIQLRPEYVANPVLLDIRVRRALAHSLDRQAINDGVFDGQGLMTDAIVAQTESFYPEVDRAIMRYPYDPRRSEQLMNEAGLVKDRDGFFANGAGERFRLDFQRVNGSEAEQLQLIQTDTWQRAGFEVRPYALPAAQLQTSGEQRHTFPGIQMKGGATERSWISSEIGTVENRWTGSNSAGWSSAEYDRLWEAVNTTLDRTERTRPYVQMQRLLAEQLPVFFTHFGLDTHAHPAALRGPTGETVGTGTFTPTTLRLWNIYEWEWQ